MNYRRVIRPDRSRRQTGPGSIPAATSQPNTWIRVVSDGTSVALYGQTSATEPTPASWASISPALTSSRFTFRGGMIGLADGMGNSGRRKRGRESISR